MNKRAASLKQDKHCPSCECVLTVREQIPQLAFERRHVSLNGKEELSFKNIKYYNMTSRVYQTQAVYSLLLIYFWLSKCV